MVGESGCDEDRSTDEEDNDKEDEEDEEQGRDGKERPPSVLQGEAQQQESISEREEHGDH